MATIYKNHKHRVVTAKGHDQFGPWTMTIAVGQSSMVCPVCNETVDVLLTYYQLRLPADIPVDKTILQRTRRPIGVSCGDWSKFTRQVVHITESALRKGLPV